jgi:hypothetical protein
MRFSYAGVDGNESWGVPARASLLLTHHFNDDAFRPLTVELGVVNLLPGPEIQFSVRDRDDDLMMNDEAFEVGIAVGFTRAMVVVIVLKRRQLLQLCVNILYQAVFGVIHVDSRCNVHG